MARGRVARCKVLIVLYTWRCRMNWCKLWQWRT